MGKIIEEFLSVSSGYGYGYGYGSGSGDGYGDGSGFGSGDGDGYGYGDGSGYGSGSGDGYGYGYGSGSGYGDGYGYGYGYRIKNINGDHVYLIDNVQTIIKSVRGNIARGYILQSDLTLTPCFVVKEANQFAHGETLHDAFDSLHEKIYSSETDEEKLNQFKEKFTDFNVKYSAKELFSWHGVLTGSCKAGRTAFCKDHDIDIDQDSFTIHEFIELTKNSYGGDIINKLLE